MKRGPRVRHNRIAHAISLLRAEVIELNGQRGRLEEMARQQQERIAILNREIARLEEVEKGEKENGKDPGNHLK